MSLLTRRVRGAPSLLPLLLIYALFVGSYWIVRYNGNLMEGDAAVITLASESALMDGSITNADYLYHAGFGSTSQLAIASTLTGLNVQTVQRYSGVWIVLVALVAFACYRELTDSAIVGAVAVLLLLLQPDFIFYVLRESHEKFTWIHFLLLLFVLLRSIKATRHPLSFGCHVAVFYLLYWALTSTNAYFATTVLISLVLACAIGLAAMLIVPAFPRAAVNRASVRRFALAGGASILLLYLTVMYAYPPLQSYFNTLELLSTRLSGLLRAVEPASNPYSTVARAWRTQLSFVAVIAGQATIALLAASCWIWGVRRFIRGRGEGVSVRWQMLWLLSAAWALELIVGVLFDFSGFLGSNLQVRLFPPFAILASPLAALTVVELVRRARELRLPARLVTSAAAALILIYCSAASLLKATNDPLVSNLWLLYTRSETRAVMWADNHLIDRDVWIDTWTHLFDVLKFENGIRWRTSNHYFAGTKELRPRAYALVTQLTRLRANQANIVLPDTTGRHIVYDNGDAQLYSALYQPPSRP